MPTQAKQPFADGYQLQKYRIRKVLSRGGSSNFRELVPKPAGSRAAR